MQLLIAHHNAAVRDALLRVADLLVGDVDVVEREGGTDTLDLLLAAEEPTVAVVEWDLPGLDGPELCRLLTQFHEGMPPYVILIARASHRIAEGLDAGAADCVRAPVDREELRARLEVGRRFVEQAGRRERARVSLVAERSPFDGADDGDDCGLEAGFELQSVLVRD